MNYSLQNLKKLRELTGVGIRECIKALQSNDNDFEKAVEWLKLRSLSSSKSSNMKEGDKESKFGLVKIESRGNKIVAFSLKCESDFVAMNDSFIDLSLRISELILDNFDAIINSVDQKKEIEDISKNIISEFSYSLKEKIYIDNFKISLKNEDEVFGRYVHHNKKVGSFVVIRGCDEKFANEISLQVVANNPSFISKDLIPSVLMNSKVQEIKEETLESNSGKNAAVIERIVEGKINKWLSEICFLEQNDFRDPSLKIKDILNSNNSLLGDLCLMKVSG